MAVDILKVSSKGQVVLPMSMRKRLSIETGARLVAYATEDCILLKVLHVPATDEFKAKMDEAQAWARSVGYTEEDISDIIKSTREKKRK